MSQENERRNGMLQALGSYVIWGLLPIYWKLIHSVSALEILSHRIIWSCMTLAVIILGKKEWRKFIEIVWQARVLKVMSVTTLLLGANWLIYIWAVNNNFVIETSLGYFINPLISVLMGVVLLRERLRVGQWIAIASAATGVLYLTFSYGRPPIISLSLAITWALYGLIKKKAPLGSLYGLSMETALLLLPAAFYLGFLEAGAQASFLNTSIRQNALLVGTGLVTTIPLLLFASAVRRIPLSLIGILQYLAPSIQFLLGRFVFKENFSTAQFIGFAFVWFALIIFVTENLLQRRQKVALP